MSPRRNREPSALAKAYLVAYNTVSWYAWTYVLGWVVKDLLNSPENYAQMCGKVGWALTIVQTGAILEIFHSIIGIVRSPVLTTTVQVFSRIMLVWGILFMFPHWAFTTMTIAWCITESIRYSYYAMNLVDFQSDGLLWARYTFFYALYPIGATSEAILIYQSLGAAKAFNTYYYFYLIFLLITYPPVFLHMYTHMMIQRKKYLNPKEKKSD
ncbi:PTPLA-domain-containing protein [Basidiobolus meristosporus CBS 931.73]|uniref:Very-long-chain (3R)-3-hydroxyacyl-CoA dehydratase n=1 Tax=Basidiobolus meristosporus CBS 931.73 TaxID=1314790 RepID=A0A1Y1XSB0_9FUNG|nr:PTPLA-domain-containing protein [Basidiobolus meristosporus CBS 931.73]|eukprot:ORX88613.1 PTPLA-domain-containing protein [Basidiobolus meristosporus CBS 931.73]